MTLLEKFLQRKIDKINRAMYDDTNFCSRYHIHRIRKYDDNNYITLEFNDKETSYTKLETHTAKEWLSNELIYYFIAKAIRESNNSLYSNEQLQRKKIINEKNIYENVTKAQGPIPKKEKEKETSYYTHIRANPQQIITDVKTLLYLPLEKGVVYYTTDTEEVYIDTETQRIKL